MPDNTLQSFYVRFRGKVTGPVTRDELLAGARAGRVGALHEVSSDRAAWRSLREWEAATRPVIPLAETEPSTTTIPLADETRYSQQTPAPGSVLPAPPSLPPVGAVTSTPRRAPRRVEPPPIPQSYEPAAAPTNGLAVAGFVCSIVGFFVFGVLAVVGLILSAVALGRPQGRGMAVAGLVIGIVGTVGWALLIVLALQH
jgi:hypothetical protein